MTAQGQRVAKLIKRVWSLLDAISTAALTFSEWVDEIKTYTIVERELDSECDPDSGKPLLDRPVGKYTRRYRDDATRWELDHSSDPPKRALVPLSAEQCRHICEDFGLTAREMFERMETAITEAEEAAKGISEDISARNPQTFELAIGVHLDRLGNDLADFRPIEYRPLPAVGQCDAFHEYLDSGEVVKELIDLLVWLEHMPAVEPGAKVDPIAQALGMLAADREMPVAEIARKVRLSRSTLYRDEHFKAARRVLRAGKKQDEAGRQRRLPRGRIDEHGSLEAWRE